MNLFCEEIHKLEAEFKQCRKMLNAIGDENRQHLICVMMNMPIDGGLVLEIVEQTHAGDYLACLERDYDLNAQAQRIASNGMPACEELIREAESFLRGN